MKKRKEVEIKKIRDDAGQSIWSNKTKHKRSKFKFGHPVKTCFRS